MAKITGPLLSFGATGSVGKTLVLAKWRGISYARSHVVPANPQSINQTVIHSTFALLREMWKLAPAQLQDAWNAFAQGRPFTGMNKLVGENVRVLKYEPDMQNFIASPGAQGGLAPLTFNAATGGAAGEIVCTFTVPAAPNGWTLQKAVAIGFVDQAPDSIFIAPIAVGEDTAAPWSVTLTNLPAGESCVCCGWLVWEKSDGKLAYSVSLTDTALADA